MSDGTAQDAAFGPVGNLGSSAVNLDGLVRQLQQALNARGFGPLAVSGQLDAPTVDALRRAGVSIDPNALDLAKLQQVATQLMAPPIGPNAPPADQPIWKRPNFWLGAVAVAAVVGYVAYRAGAFDSSPLGEAHEPEDEPEKPEKKHYKAVKKPKEKCSTELPDFDEAEPLKEN